MAREPEETEAPYIPEIIGKTLIIDGVSWAIGLNWSAATEKTLNIKSARAQTKYVGADLFVLNGGRQLGTTNSQVGHKNTLPSLAMAMVLEAGSQNIVGAFKVSNGQYYVFAVKEGVVWPTFDDVYPFEEARSMVYDLTQRIEYDRIYGDPKVVINPTAADTLHDLTRGVKTRRCRLQGISRKSTYIKLFSIAAVAGIAYLGYTFYQKYELQQLINQGQEEEAQAEQQQQREAQLNQPVYPPMPSISALRAIDALKACTKFMDAIPAYLPGWNETSLTCDGNSVTLTMTNDNFGTINWLEPFIGQYKNPTITVLSPTIATATWPLDSSSIKTWGNVPGPQTSITTRYLVSQFAEANLDVTLGDPAIPQVNTHTVGDRPITVAATYNQTTLDIPQTPYIHDQIADILGRVQNVVLLQAEEDLPERAWTLNFVIYHDISNDPGVASMVPIQAASP